MYLNRFLEWNYALKMLKLYSKFTVKHVGFTTCGSSPHHRGSFSIFERCRTSVCCFHPGGMLLTSIRRANSSGLGSCCRVFFPFTFRFGALLYQSRQSFVCSRPVSVMDHQLLRPPVRLLSVLLCQLSAWLMPGDCSAGLWYSVSLGCRRPRLSEIK